jgi:hypothetical protein
MLPEQRSSLRRPGSQGIFELSEEDIIAEARIDNSRSNTEEKLLSPSCMVWLMLYAPRNCINCKYEHLGVTRRIAIGEESDDQEYDRTGSCEDGPVPDHHRHIPRLDELSTRHTGI